MNEMIYVVEDETDILELIRIKLKAAGFKSRGFETAVGLQQIIRTEAPDLIILDLMLPDLDGMEFCRLLKSDPGTEKIPILMLTARAEIEDRVKGLEYGADDYLTKPFDASELIARLHAILRRSSWESSKNVLQITPDFLLDFDRYEAYINQKRVDLTLTEFKILQLLTKRPGWVYKRGQILDYLWGNDN
ncbi:MAG TPA: response regulator [Candidatus Cloacimonadota bacterium]|nr:response regulator [Candidatus Cloacimonadota bacterium]